MKTAGKAGGSDNRHSRWAADPRNSGGDGLSRESSAGAACPQDFGAGFSTWPPKPARIADSTLLANSSLSREEKRP